MRLTLIRRLDLCWEILTTRSGHKHPSHEKQLSIFQRGYEAGMKDARLEHEAIRKACARRAEEVVFSLSAKDARDNIKRAVLNA